MIHKVLSDSHINQLGAEFPKAMGAYARTQIELVATGHRLTQPKAQEYAVQGAGRRFRLIHQCIANIYRLYPPQQTQLLADKALLDIDVNLHAFFVNVFGLLDNLAWAVAYEKRLVSKIHRNDITLYGKDLKKNMAPAFRKYLNTERIKKWHYQHLKDFRDALAHRVPPYLPPYVQVRQVSGQDTIHPCPWYGHSLDETKNHIYMHAQLLADFNTVVQIVERFCDLQFPDPAKAVTPSTQNGPNSRVRRRGTRSQNRSSSL